MWHCAIVDGYSLVSWHSHGKSTVLMAFTGKDVDFPWRFVSLPVTSFISSQQVKQIILPRSLPKGSYCVQCTFQILYYCWFTSIWRRYPLWQMFNHQLFIWNCQGSEFWAVFVDCLNKSMFVGLEQCPNQFHSHRSPEYRWTLLFVGTFGNNQNRNIICIYHDVMTIWICFPQLKEK